MACLFYKTQLNLQKERYTTCDTAHLKYQTPDESGEIVDQCEQREYTFQEMKALIELSGIFTLKKVLGSWDINILFSNDTASWRMILVLQKIT